MYGIKCKWNAYCLIFSENFSSSFFGLNKFIFGLKKAFDVIGMLRSVSIIQVLGVLPYAANSKGPLKIKG
jgi:hypothetical protein